jgi:nucleoid DNA-binding protein
VKNAEKNREILAGPLTLRPRILTFAVPFGTDFPTFLGSFTMAKANGTSRPKSITKGQIYEAIAQEAGSSKGEVKKFFTALESVVSKQLGKKGPGVITLPGMVKLTAIKKQATKGGERRPNPFKPGEFIITKPKPASVKVRARALKAFAEALK